MRLPVARQSKSQKDQWNRGVGRGAPGGRSCSPRLRQCGLGLMQLATMGLFHPQLCRSTFTLIMSPLCVRNISQCFCTLEQYLVTYHCTTLLRRGFLVCICMHFEVISCLIMMSFCRQLPRCTLALLLLNYTCKSSSEKLPDI